MGLANKVCVLLCLCAADPSFAESSVIACMVWSRPKGIKYTQQGHTEPLTNYFSLKVDAVWRGLHKGWRAIAFSNPILTELAPGSQAAAWSNGQDKAAKLKHFLSVTTKIKTLCPQPNLWFTLHTAALATERFFGSYWGSSLMPKETASPQQHVEKAEMKGTRNHVIVYAGKWAHTSVAIKDRTCCFSNKTRFQTKWRPQAERKGRHVGSKDSQNCQLILNLNKLGAEAANGGHRVKHTGIISLHQHSITFPNEPAPWIILSKLKAPAHPGTGWLRNTKDLSLGVTSLILAQAQSV